MALETNPQLGKGGSGMHTTGDGTAAKMILELQGLKQTVVAGAAADTDIAIAGIKVTDTILSVIEFAAGVPTDRTSVASITSAGNIQLTVDTTGDSLLVSYYVKPV